MTGQSLSSNSRNSNRSVESLSFGGAAADNEHEGIMAASFDWWPVASG
jgi:hypothetical protein